MVMGLITSLQVTDIAGNTGMGSLVGEVLIFGSLELPMKACLKKARRVAKASGKRKH